jgi:hypothetical protein
MDTPAYGNEHRYRVEREKLTSAWDTIAIDSPWGAINNIGGTIQPIPDGPIRDFRIDVPLHYPFDSPRSYAIGWLVGGPHCYPATNEMCLWQFNDWSPRYTLAYAVSKTYVWIHKYEEWLRSGKWPGNQQRH